MKKLTLLLFAILVTFTSCKKDDEKFKISDIEGKWYLYEVYDSKNSKWLPTSGTTLANEYSEFKKDGSYKTYSGESTYTGTFKIEGETVVCNVEGMIVKYYIIDIDGNIITFDLEYDNDGDKERLRGKK